MEFIDDKIYMLVPVYDVVGTMEERYEEKSGGYTSLGKSDSITINNKHLYLNYLDSIASQFVKDSNIVYDSQYDKVYLAVWSSQEDLHNKVMKLYYQFEDRFEISRFAVLDQEMFTNDEGLDYETIRDYFRFK